MPTNITSYLKHNIVIPLLDFQMATLLEEKDENITQLQERVATLEKREVEGTLSDDERVKALEAEVRPCCTNTLLQFKRYGLSICVYYNQHNSYKMVSYF